MTGYSEVMTPDMARKKLPEGNPLPTSIHFQKTSHCYLLSPVCIVLVLFYLKPVHNPRLHEIALDCVRFGPNRYNYEMLVLERPRVFSFCPRFRGFQAACF
jgi:hypothetical protein